MAKNPWKATSNFAVGCEGGGPGPEDGGDYSIDRTML
jgi:hypothetical protein